MKAFKTARWIWQSESAGADEYAEFYPRFCVAEEQLKSGEKIVCRISCDGDYTLFIAGRYVASNQYGDFEHYKIYDELDLTPHLRAGENELKILVWHFGADTQRYKSARAGVIFEIAKRRGQDEELLFASDTATPCRRSPGYKSGYQKKITPQLGFSFLYDATRENEPTDLRPAVIVEKNCMFYPSPVQKLKIGERTKAKIIEAAENGAYYLIDLGKESVGLPVLEFSSETTQKITVFWGEDLQNRHVRGEIGGRNFSFEYIAKAGKNNYTNYMLRLGCRYLEVFAERGIRLNYAGILPQYYPVCEEYTSNEREFISKKDKEIYDLCERTLKLCMMEHYVDTPWREQCLYAFDARNQMLCGYYAFENGNAAYARANLKLMSEDRREDGLLSICYPCGVNLTIPSFSLHFITAAKEYLAFTGDTAFLKEIYPKILSVLQTFLLHRKDGLVYRFGGKEHWNFYDWSAYAEGSLGAEGQELPDLFINCLFVLALENVKYIAGKLGEAFAYDKEIRETREAAQKAFFDKKDGVFTAEWGEKKYTVLGNALAVLSEVAAGETAKTVCEKIADGKMQDCSLSMKTFKYDALLKCDKAKYKSAVLEEIRKDYGKMLAAGATSVWETTDGASAFENAGSLCHGWSAIPIIYFETLLR